jgi:hypothetical protein
MIRICPQLVARDALPILENTGLAKLKQQKTNPSSESPGPHHVALMAWNLPFGYRDLITLGQVDNLFRTIALRGVWTCCATRGRF